MFSPARVLGFALTLALASADVVTEGTPIGSLWAYGSGISGLPVIYSDGKTFSLSEFIFGFANKTIRHCCSWLGTPIDSNRSHERDL